MQRLKYHLSPLTFSSLHEITHVPLQVEKARKALEYAKIGPIGDIEDDEVRRKVECLLKSLNGTDCILNKVFKVLSSLSLLSL
jgi:hypothetical protein